MRPSLFSVPLLAVALAAASSEAVAQSKPPVQPPAKAEQGHAGMDHAAMHAEHMKQQGGKAGAKADAWKELDAYHMLMMATWHPAKERNDLGPIRGQVEAMVKAAELVGASTPPGSCAKPELAAARSGLAGETRKVAALVKTKADDAALKAALR